MNPWCRWLPTWPWPRGERASTRLASTSSPSTTPRFCFPYLTPFQCGFVQEDYCHAKYTGRRPLVDLAEQAGVLQLPSPNPIELRIEAMNLAGKNGVWGSSMVLLGPGRERICATLLPDSRQLKVEQDLQLFVVTVIVTTQVAEARFTSPVAGSVFFLSLSLGASIETKIFTNLYHVVAGKTTSHSWQIYITVSTASPIFLVKIYSF